MNIDKNIGIKSFHVFFRLSLVLVMLAAGCGDSKKGAPDRSPSHSEKEEKKPNPYGAVSVNPLLMDKMPHDLLVIQCTNENVTTVRPLISFLSHLRWDLNIDLGGDELSLTDRLELVFQRLAVLDEEKAATYRKMLREFESERRYFNEIDLPLQEDAQEDFGPLPAGCVIKSYASLQQPMIYHDRYYTFDLKLWKAFTATDQALAVLEAIVSRDAFNRGHYDLRHARYFASVLASVQISKWDQTFYEEVALSARMNEILAGEDIRYFPKLLMTYDEGFAFCQSLPAEKARHFRIWDGNSGNYDLFDDMAYISRDLMASSHGKRAKVWVYDSFDTGNVLFYDDDLKTLKDDSFNKNHVICEQSF